MPSFHMDLHAGRKKSEVEYLHGAVVRYGEISGIQTPVSRLLTQTLLAMGRGEISDCGVFPPTGQVDRIACELMQFEKNNLLKGRERGKRTLYSCG